MDKKICKTCLAEKVIKQFETLDICKECVKAYSLFLIRRRLVSKPMIYPTVDFVMTFK